MFLNHLKAAWIHLNVYLVLYLLYKKRFWFCNVEWHVKVQHAWKPCKILWNLIIGKLKGCQYTCTLNSPNIRDANVKGVTVPWSLWLRLFWIVFSAPCAGHHPRWHPPPPGLWWGHSPGQTWHQTLQTPWLFQHSSPIAGRPGHCSRAKVRLPQHYLP